MNAPCSLFNQCSYCRTVYHYTVRFASKKTRNSDQTENIKQQVVYYQNHENPVILFFDFDRETIADLMLQIQEREGIIPCRQALSANSETIIDPKQLLKDCQPIVKSHQIQLILKQRKPLPI